MMSDDITFCMSECYNEDCFRHPSNIIDRLIPHSYSDFNGTEACPMNNKKLGTEFEKQVVDLLSKQGYWVHFITPDSRGAQPFDIIAVKDGMAVALDCKTCVNRYFSISRLEENQLMAFDKWLSCKNTTPLIAVLHKDKITMIDYLELKMKGRIDLEKEM